MTLAPKRRWLRFSLRTLFALAIGGVAWGAWTAYRIVYITVPNCYAVWWVADMATEFMATHNDAWPSGWDDLREPYETLTKRSGRPWTFDELRSRVNVDWDADPEILAEALPTDKEPPIRVIWLRDGSATYWSGQEPNQMVLEYLRSRQTQKGHPFSSRQHPNPPPPIPETPTCYNVQRHVPIESRLRKRSRRAGASEVEQ
jgi:hypothetical protein